MAIFDLCRPTFPSFTEFLTCSRETIFSGVRGFSAIFWSPGVGFWRQAIGSQLEPDLKLFNHLQYDIQLGSITSISPWGFLVDKQNMKHDGIEWERNLRWRNCTPSSYVKASGLQEK